MKRFTTIITIIGFLAALQTVCAQDHSNWKRSIGGNQGSAMISTCATTDKGVVLFCIYQADGKEQYLLTKLNAQGIQLWQHFFDNQLFKSYDFYPSFIEIEPDEFILVASNVLIRCNAFGKVKYHQNMEPVDGFLQTSCMIMMDAHTIGVCGVSFAWGQRQPQVWYALYTPQLQLIAQQKIVLPPKYEPHRAIITPNQQLIITGMENKDTLVCKAENDTYCKKMFLKSWNFLGIPTWEVPFDQSYQPTFLKQNANGAILITYLGGKKGQKGFTGNFMKVSAQGKVLHDIHYITQNGENSHNHFQDVLETHDNGFLLVGNSNNLNRPVRNYSCFGLNDFLVVKLDGQGKKQWEQEWGGSEGDHAQFIVKTIDNQYIVIGNARSNNWDVIDSPIDETKKMRLIGCIWCIGISDE
jgi:hypothetical protein